jgi:hypothetical protein
VSCDKTGAQAPHWQSYVRTAERSGLTAARSLVTGASFAAMCGTGVATFAICGEIDATPGLTNEKWVLKIGVTVL